MTKLKLKDNTILEVVIRNGQQQDIEKLVQLNKRWQKMILGDNLKDGYVGAAFSEDTFLELINREQIVLTAYNNTIGGYYLLNNISKDGIIGKHEDIVTTLKQSGKIEQKKTVCVGAQAIVDVEFMGTGIRQLMLYKLIENMKGKFDYLFATIAKDNHRAFKAHTRDGWQILGEDDSLFYVVFKV